MANILSNIKKKEGNYMADTKVREIQIWLNSVYKDNENWVTIKEDGITGNNTVAGLIRALQIELGVGVDGVMGNGTKEAFDAMYPNGLSKDITPSTQKMKNINFLYIVME